MSRIVSAVNAMILNSDKINSVVMRQGEYYFLYDHKYKWSIQEEENDLILRLYTKQEQSLEDVISSRFFSNDMENMAVYSAREIGTREAWQSFRELFNFVKEKALGVADILNDIISGIDDDIPF